jgi:hypothetical protein
LTEVLIAALIVSAVALFIFFQGKRPQLEVKVAPKEAAFEERLEIRNHGQNTYSYRIRVGGKYLKFARKGTFMSRIILPPGDAAGVILDEVAGRLAYDDIVIECAGWLPWFDKAVVFKRRFDELR